MLKRLRRSMTALCAAGAAVIGAVLVLVSLWISERQLKERGQAVFTSGVNAIAFRLSTENTLDWTWLSRMEADSGVIAYIEDNGAPLLFSGRAQGEKRRALAQVFQGMALEQGVDVKKRPTSALVNARTDFSANYDGEMYRVCIIVIRTEKGYKSLTAIGETSGEQGLILRQRLQYLGLLAASVAAFILFGWWFTGKAIRPVAESRRRQAEFIAAASHELRTPLAVIRTNAAALNANTTESRFVSAIERECARTGKLVDDLLMLANADAGTWRMDIAPVEPLVLLTECAEAFRAPIEAKNQHLTLNLPETLPIVAGDELRLKQLAAILLDNACNYTPENGRIDITAGTEGKNVFFTVADSGPGIPEEERDRVFERFYRLDKARSGKEHYGLGLSIAKEIAELHSGKVSLSETQGDGLTVTVRLPAAHF